MSACDFERQGGSVGVVEHVALDGLVPENVIVSERRDDRDAEPLLRGEADFLLHAGLTRRSEFRTARRCVREALLPLGLARPPMVPGVAGAPTWPSGIVGSITHCRGYRAAAVAKSVDAVSIGIDAEVRAPFSPGVLQLVANQSEEEHLVELERMAPEVPWGRLLFSAKESVFKAWYPVAKTLLDASMIAVRLEPWGGFLASLSQPLVLADGRVIEDLYGRWASDKHHLLSAVVVV